MRATLVLPLDAQGLRCAMPLLSRAIAHEISRQRETPVLEDDVIIGDVTAGVRGRALEELSMVTFTICPSGESVSADSVRQGVMSLSFATGVLQIMERGHIDEKSLVALPGSGGGADQGWSDAGGVGGMGTGAGVGHKRGPRGEGLVGEVKCAQFGVNDVDDQGTSALHWAALNGRMEVVKALLQQGAMLNQRSSDGQTPLHWAAIKGQLFAVDALCSAGAELDCLDKWGFSALMRGAQNGHTLLVLFLLRYAANSY